MMAQIQTTWVTLCLIRSQGAVCRILAHAEYCALDPCPPPLTIVNKDFGQLWTINNTKEDQSESILLNRLLVAAVYRK